MRGQRGRKKKKTHTRADSHGKGDLTQEKFRSGDGKKFGPRELKKISEKCSDKGEFGKGKPLLEGYQTKRDKGQRNIIKEWKNL